MAKDFFQFKHFTIHQSLCAMKVGTDGTLLGAWAKGGRNILDIGTGTGIIALMMAQRYPNAYIVGIDIDEDAVKQATENVLASPFRLFRDEKGNVVNRIFVRHQNIEDVMDADGYYDAIVSNPPFFDASLNCPDKQRDMARHTDTLSFSSLFANVWRLLSDKGEFSIIVPIDIKSKIDAQSALVGFFKVRECRIKTLPNKQPKRVLMAFRKHPAEIIDSSDALIEDCPGKRSEWYSNLTKDFYLW